jgi:hypothetical protein
MKGNSFFFLLNYSIQINRSPNHRRRPKRSSINNNANLSTVTSVHELMSFIIHKGSNSFIFSLCIDSN